MRAYDHGAGAAIVDQAQYVDADDAAVGSLPELYFRMGVFFGFEAEFLGIVAVCGRRFQAELFHAGFEIIGSLAGAFGAGFAPGERIAGQHAHIILHAYLRGRGVAAGPDNQENSPKKIVYLHGFGLFLPKVRIL